jgi:putative ABC transport system ATP-binding protein
VRDVLAADSALVRILTLPPGAPGTVAEVCATGGPDGDAPPTRRTPTPARDQPRRLVASRLLAGPLVGRAEREQSTLATGTAAATDLVTRLRVRKGIGAEPAAASSYAQSSQTALRARLAAVTVEGGFLGVTTALTGLLLVVVAWVAGRLALAGTISIGELVAAVGLAQFLTAGGLTRLGQMLAGAQGAAGRVANLLGAPAAVTHGDAMLPDAVEGTARSSTGPCLRLAPGEHLGAGSPIPARRTARRPGPRRRARRIVRLRCPAR